MKYLIFCLCIWCFFSCKKIEKGKVVSKKYEPKHSYIKFFHFTTHIGKSTVTNLIPYCVTDNEDYILRIQDIIKGDTITKSVYVSKDIYNCVSNGDMFIIGSGCDFYDKNNTKVKK